MTETPADYLTDIHEANQGDAAIEAASKAVARHYAYLVSVGMDTDGAVLLCDNFQRLLMGGNDATVTFVGVDE